MPEAMQLFDVKTIDEVTEKIIDYRGKTPPKTHEGIKLITAKVIKDGYILNDKHEYISEKTYQEWMTRGFPKKWDVLITTEAPLGEVALLRTEERIALAQRVILLRGKPGIIDQRYYMYALKTSFVQDQLKANSVSTTVAGIKQSDLREIRIPYFPLKEQKRIATIAQKADRLRRTRRYTLEMSDSYLRSVFLEMFGDPVANTKEWEVLPFEKVVINQDSKRKPIKESERANRLGIYPYYGAVGIIDYIDDFLFSTTNLLIEEDGMNLITRTKPIAFVVSGKYWVNNHAHVVSDNGLVNLHYLAMSLNMRDITDFVTGIDQMKLTQDNLDKILIQIPPRSLQEKFAQIVQRFERLRIQQREAERQAEHLFQTILHRAFRGEL